MTATTLGLDHRPDRCQAGYAPVQHPQLCSCAHVPALKAAGIAAANDNAAPDVKARIDAAIRRIAASGREFSANDLRADLAGITGPVVGGRFTALSNAGVISFTGKRVASNLGSTHGHEIKVWRAAA